MKYLLLLLILLTPQATNARMSWSGGASSTAPCTASAPTQASAAGYVKLAACSNMQEAWDIDLYNTKLPNLNFYMQHCCRGQTITPPACIGTDGTGTALTCDNTYVGGGYNETLSTVYPTGSAPYYGGNAWSGGFYAEVSLKIGSISGGSGSGWPVMWFTSLSRMTTYSGGCPIGCTFPSYEIDVAEFNPGVSPPPPLWNVYMFTSSPGGVNAGYGKTSNQPSLGSPTFTNYNKYGVLWVTAAKNPAQDGTGYIAFYFNDVLVNKLVYSATGTPTPSTCTTPYSGSTTCPTGTFSGIDSDTLFAMFGTDSTGGTKPVYKNFHVWQTP